MSKRETDAEEVSDRMTMEIETEAKELFEQRLPATCEDVRIRVRYDGWLDSVKIYVVDVNCDRLGNVPGFNVTEIDFSNERVRFVAYEETLKTIKERTQSY